MPVNMLIDNGSTSTILSYNLYLKLVNQTREDLQLLPITHKLYDVNGHPLQTYGSLSHRLMLGKTELQITSLVCNIQQEVILGQDFLLTHIDKIDYKRQMLTMNNEQINCWIGGEANAKCRVIVHETVTIPGKSKMIIPITIENSEHLGPFGYIEPKDKPERQERIYITRGVLDPHQDQPAIQAVNFEDEPVTLHAKELVGICESYYESPAIGRCCHITVQGSNNQTLPDHLKTMYTKSCENLKELEKQKLLELLCNYEDVFAKSADDLGRTNRVLHRINTGTAAPIRIPPRRLPFGKREIEKAEIEKLLGRGVIEPSNSPWSFRTVLIAKKDGSTRVCVDYRALNNVIIKDAYPLPRVDDCLDALAGAKWLSCLDLNQGFYQIELHKDDREKTAFSSSQGLFQFTVTPFGLATSPSVFERLMEDVLRGLQWEECLLYMDDIIVPGSSFEEEIERLEHVFQRMREANLKLKPSKCFLFQKSVKFLGHVVSEEGIQTDPDKTTAVQNWPRPRNAKEIKSFLGLCSYYRKFVRNFADIARPLHKISLKNPKFTWTEECQQSFVALKAALTSPPILIYPQPGKQFILDTDASNHSVGAILSQQIDEREHVIAYMSKAMNKHETSYCTTRKELLAVVVALKNFHPYLYGRKILVRTDNAAVSWMQNLKEPTGQVARWLQILGTYDLRVIHRSGSKHQNADAMSRFPCKACQRQESLNSQENETKDETKQNKPRREPIGIDQVTETKDVTKETNTSHPEPDQQLITRAVTRSKQQEGMKNPSTFLIGWQPVEIRQQQLEDKNIGPIMAAVETGRRPQWEEVSSKPSSSKTLWSQWKRLELHGGMLYRKWEEGQKPLYQLIIPDSKKEEIMKFYHDVPTAAHLGVEKTVQKVKESFYWPGMKDFIQNYCRQCDLCFARKPKSRKEKAPLGSYLVGEPMERIAIDILGPLPITKNRNRFILVITDMFTKWTEAVAIPTQESTTVAKALVDNFICRFGSPLQLHSDQGRNFESNLFKDVCSFLGIDKTRTTSFRPQSNGQVERFNRTLAAMLTMYCEKKQNTWDEYLQSVMMAYRSSVHKSTSKTPNSMVLGKEIVLPLQAVIGQPVLVNTDITDTDEYVECLKRSLKENHEIARKNLKTASVYQKRYYDLKAKKKFFRKGEAVWTYEPARKVGVCSKLTSPWKGPYIVEKQIDDVTYRIKKSARHPSKIYHVDRMSPYHGRNVPSWATWFMRNHTEHSVQEITDKTEILEQQPISLGGSEN